MSKNKLIKKIITSNIFSEFSLASIYPILRCTFSAYSISACPISLCVTLLCLTSVCPPKNNADTSLQSRDSTSQESTSSSSSSSNKSSSSSWASSSWTVSVGNTVMTNTSMTNTVMTNNAKQIQSYISSHQSHNSSNQNSTHSQPANLASFIGAQPFTSKNTHSVPANIHTCQTCNTKNPASTNQHISTNNISTIQAENVRRPKLNSDYTPVTVGFSSYGDSGSLNTVQKLHPSQNMNVSRRIPISQAHHISQSCSESHNSEKQSDFNTNLSNQTFTMQSAQGNNFSIAGINPVFLPYGGELPKEPGVYMPVIYLVIQHNSSIYNITTLPYLDRLFSFYPGNKDGATLLSEIKMICKKTKIGDKRLKTDVVKRIESLTNNGSEVFTLLKKILDQALETESKTAESSK